MDKNYLRHCALAIGATVYCLPAAAAAQSTNQNSTNSDDMIGTIVVTAQKRAQNVQDVPIAISAFSASKLSEMRVSNISALSNLAPNVTLDAGTPFSGSNSVISAYIRGIGQNDYAVNFDPGVGIYIDGIYLARAIGANMQLPDVERVEVLKGPQGTLFGRNTIGGAISVVTKDPGSDPSLETQITTGRFNRLDITAMANIPVNENLGITVTTAAWNRDGYQKRVPYPGGSAYATDPERAFRHSAYDVAGRAGGQNSWTLRSKVKWQMGDRLTLRLAADYLRTDEPATPSNVLAVLPNLPGALAGAPGNNIPGTAFDPTGQTGFQFGGLYNFCISSTSSQIAARNAQNICGPRNTPINPNEILGALGSVNVDSNAGNDRLPYDQRWVGTSIDQSYATGINYSKLRNWGLGGTFDFDVTDGLSIKSITGYRELTWRAGMDLDNSPVKMFEVSTYAHQSQFSQELQMIGDALERKLKYVLGAYYFKESASTDDHVTFAEGLLNIEAPVALKTTNYAFFGQLDFRVSDLIGLTLGGRYTYERKRFEAFQQDLNGIFYKAFNCLSYAPPCQGILGFPSPGEPLRFYPAGQQHKNFKNFSPKFGIQLHPFENVMLYTSYSRGYKTGGWTNRISAPLPIAPDFNEEKAATLETGLKAELIDRRLRFNLAAFTTDYKGIQLNFQQGVSPIFQNAGDARIRGFEAEMQAAIGHELTLSVSTGYIHARYTSVLPQSVVTPNALHAGVYVGAPLPKTPSWKINIAPRYQLDLANGSNLVFVAGYTYTSAIWNDTERTFLLRRPKTQLIDANISYNPSSRRWSLTVGGTNLTDKRFVTTGIAQLGTNLIQGTYNRPREWYLQLSAKF